jgi:FkbM family methyltransferase
MRDYIRRLREDRAMALRMARSFQFPAAKLFRQLRRISGTAIGTRDTGVDSPITSFEFLDFEVWCWHAPALRSLIMELFTEREYWFRCETPEPVIIDGGSNIGMSVLFFKTLYPGAHITAFEPDPSSFEALRTNVERNGVANVVLHNAALSAVSGYAQFFQSSTQPGDLRNGLLRQRLPTPRVLEVPSVRLSEHIGERVDVLKLDIEGAEFEVIEELHESGKLGRIDQLIVEFHHNVPGIRSRLPQSLEMLQDAGFELGIAAPSHPESDRGAFQNVTVRAERRDTRSARPRGGPGLRPPLARRQPELEL